jgi:nucleoside-diphosphate-sugar epimerase
MKAILGATGTIGRSLARKWSADDTDPVVLFARNAQALSLEAWPPHISVRHVDDFSGQDFDLIVNAIGAGDPARITAMGTEALNITHKWDDRILSTMNSKTWYVFLSSGIIYGGNFDRPAAAGANLDLPVNRLGSISPYLAAKLHAELRHRHSPDRSILDIRIFGYADATMPHDGSSFLADLARAIRRSEGIITSPEDMVRDYAGVEELDALIQCWVQADTPNQSYDLYTLEPVAKHELLELAAARYGLQIHYTSSVDASPTGNKTVYASAFHAAAAIGYTPRRRAADVVVSMLDTISVSASPLRGDYVGKRGTVSSR